MNPTVVSNRKILVTGASGFIGAHLCRELQRSGAEVHAVSRTRRDYPDTGWQWWQSDLADAGAVRKLVENVKPAVIFHLASYVSGNRALEAVAPTFQSNLLTTVNLLTAATEFGCERIVLAGSLEEPEPGDAEAIPCSPYAAAKWAGNGYARMFHALYDTPVVIARLFMVYGPAQQDLRKLIPYVTLSLLQNQAPRLSSGTRPVDWIYVQDVVDGLVTLASAPDISGKTFDLGSGQLETVREVVERLARLIDSEAKPIFGDLADRPLERVRVANVAESYAGVGWQPAYFLDRGLQLTVDWYREQLSEGRLPV